METDREALKKQHEKSISDFYIQKCQYQFKMHGDPKKNEPDLIYDNALGEILGIETSTSYYDDINAKYIWQKVRGGNDQSDFVNADDANVSIVNSIKNELIDKCGKQYKNCDKYVLVIEVFAPINSASEIEQIVMNEDGLLPNGCGVFSDIFLYYIGSNEEGSGSRLLKIWNQNGI